MTSIGKRRKILRKKIRRLCRQERALRRYERRRCMRIHRLRCAEQKDLRRKTFERKKRSFSKRETAKLNRTLRRRRKR